MLILKPLNEILKETFNERSRNFFQTGRRDIIHHQPLNDLSDSPILFHV